MLIIFGLWVYNDVRNLVFGIDSKVIKYILMVDN